MEVTESERVTQSKEHYNILYVNSYVTGSMSCVIFLDILWISNN